MQETKFGENLLVHVVHGRWGFPSVPLGLSGKGYMNALYLLQVPNENSRLSTAFSRNLSLGSYNRDVFI